MDFSRTMVVIRKRSLAELFDLSLRVYREHALTLLLLLVINATPWLLLDAGLLWFADMTGAIDGLDSFEMHWRWILLLICQSQVMTSLVTIFIGKSMFFGTITVSETIRNFRRASWYGLWLHGGIRLVIPITLLATLGDEAGLGFAVFLLMLALLVRAVRPFVSEVLYLEETPVRARQTTSGEDVITFGRRSSNLHAGSVFGTFVIASLFAIALTIMLASLLFHVDAALGLQGTSDWSIQFFYWPAGIMVIASWLAVFRFLNYVNVRIAQEGWEVSLQIQQQAIELEKRQEKRLEKRLRPGLEHVVGGTS